MNRGSIFSQIPGHLPEEIFETLAGSDRVGIERIVSCGHSSPEGFWYDQDRTEFVLVVQGSAGLRFENHEQEVVLNPGDWVEIPAHAKHRVEWTEFGRKTVWLAVFYDPVAEAVPE